MPRRSTLVVLALFALAFAPTLSWMFQGWFLDNSYFSHGPLLCVAGLWFAFERRRELAATAPESSGLGRALLALCLFVHVLAQALQVDSLSGLVLVPALLALVLALEGRARLLILAAPICCLLFAIPLPVFVSGSLAYTMKHQATAAAVALTELFGHAAVQEGATILLPESGERLFVGEACSGLRSLVALTALGYVYAFFLTPRRLVGRFVFALLALPIALGANFLRIAILAMIAEHKGAAFAAGTAHDVSGYLLYLVAILVLLAVDRVLPGRRRGRRPPPVEAEVTAAPDARHTAVVVAGLGLPALVLGFYRPSGETSLARAVPASVGEFRAVVDHELSERWFALLGTRDVCWRSYENEDEDWEGVLTLVFHERNWKSLHPPSVCLEASGYEFRERGRRTLSLGAEEVEISVLEVERGPTRYLVGFAFGGSDFVTPSYLGFFWRNIPYAILRRRARGFLCRIDLPWRAGVSRGEAEARLDRMMRSFLELSRKLVGTRP